MADNWIVKYTKMFPNDPVVFRMLSADQFKTAKTKMKKAVKDKKPFGPKDFGMDAWYPDLEGNGGDIFY